MQRGVDTLTAEEIVRLADLLKPRGRPVATLSALLDELEASSRQMIAGLLPPGDPMRRSRLHALRFTPEEVPLARLRPWPGMGGLPCRWTDSADVVQLASRIRRQGVPRQADRLEQMLLWSRLILVRPPSGCAGCRPSRFQSSTRACH
jgi:hypothetical protein